MAGAATGPPSLDVPRYLADLKKRGLMIEQDGALRLSDEPTTADDGGRAE